MKRAAVFFSCRHLLIIYRIHIIMTEKVVVLLVNSIFLVAGEDLFDALYVFGLVLGDKAY